MSKSKRNVVDPELIIAQYGADTARLFMLSDSPPERDMEWTESGVEGASRFLKRVHRMACEIATLDLSEGLPTDGPAFELVRTAHKSILALSKDIEDFRFNRAVAQLHTLANAISELKDSSGAANAARFFAIKSLAQLIAPLAPHVAEEMWAVLGEDQMLALSAWPVADADLAKEDAVEIGVQVNGKLRGTITLDRDCDKDVAEAEALASPAIVRYLDGATPRKVIVVPNRIVNVVI